MSFGKTLREIRRSKDKSQRELADLLDLDYGYLSRLENDKVQFNPSRDFIMKIVVELSCNDDEKAKLLMEAGRIDVDLEKAAQEANTRPELNVFFKSAVKLPVEDIIELTERIQQMIKAKDK